MAMSENGQGSFAGTGENFSRKSLLGESGPARTATLILIGVVAVLQLIGAASIDLILGEAYYLSSARELHLAYFDQPPISLWMIWFAKTVFQTEAPVFLRLPFVLTYMGVNWMVFRIGARFAGDWAGFSSTLVMNIAILFILSIGSWLQPDTPLMFFWLAAVWVLLDIFFDDADARPYWKWMWVGVWLGLTFLSKYHAVFLVFGAGIFAITHVQARRWIVHPGPYLALAIAAVFSLPVLIWNFNNNWASFAFQGTRAVGTGFHLDWLIRMMLGQLIYITPWIALPALFAAGRAVWRGPQGAFPDSTTPGFAWFLVCMAVGPIVFFTAVAAGTDTQFHFHWQAPGYMMLFPLLGGWIVSAYSKHRGLIRWWLGISGVATFVLLTVLITHTATGWLRPVLNIPAEAEDPTSGALEWRELGQWFEQSGALEEPNTFAAGVHWTDCGQIDKPLAGRLPFACLSQDPRNLAFNIDLAEHEGWTAYVVARHRSADELKSQMSGFFESVEWMATFDIVRNGVAELHDIHIVKATGLKLDYQLAPAGANTASVQRLPRLAVAGIRGTLRLPVEAGETAILLDGKQVASVTPDPSGETPFILAIEDGEWTVGMSTATITLAPQKALPDDVYGFTDLAVTLR